jgi:hypothetical protein
MSGRGGRKKRRKRRSRRRRQTCWIPFVFLECSHKR